MSRTKEFVEGGSRPTCEGTGQPPHTNPTKPPADWKLWGRVQCSACHGHYFTTKDGVMPKHKPKKAFDW